MSKLAGGEFGLRDGSRAQGDATPLKRRAGKPVFAADHETKEERLARLTGIAKIASDHRYGHTRKIGVSQHVQNVDPRSKRSISFNTYITGYPRSVYAQAL